MHSGSEEICPLADMSHHAASLSLFRSVCVLTPHYCVLSGEETENRFASPWFDATVDRMFDLLHS
jgi:hypothetical protein